MTSALAKNFVVPHTTKTGTKKKVMKAIRSMMRSRMSEPIESAGLYLFLRHKMRMRTASPIRAGRMLLTMKPMRIFV